MLFINKLFNSIACLLYFINLQLVIPGRTWILLYLGRTVYKRLWACLALYHLKNPKIAVFTQFGNSKFTPKAITFLINKMVCHTLTMKQPYSSREHSYAIYILWASNKHLF